MDLLTKQEVANQQAARLELALVHLSECTTIKCCSPDTCREGDECYNHDVYAMAFHDVQQVARELRGEGGYITKD